MIYVCVGVYDYIYYICESVCASRFTSTYAFVDVNLSMFLCVTLHSLDLVERLQSLRTRLILSDIDSYSRTHDLSS